MEATARRSMMIDVPEGVEGTRMTLHLMKRLANSEKTDPRLMAIVDQLRRSVPEKAFYREAEAIHNYVRDRIRYQFDPVDYEMLHAPLATLDKGAGDCDDKCILEAALLKMSGHPVQFVALAQQPDAFSHVYLQTLIGRDWVSGDPTERQPFGWEPQGISRLIMSV